MTKITRPFGLAINLPKGIESMGLIPAKFTIEGNELRIEGCVNFVINGIFLNDVTKIENINGKIKFYCKQNLFGVIYLKNDISVSFLLTAYDAPLKIFNIATVFINELLEDFNFRKDKNNYEIKLAKYGNLFHGLIIQSNKYHENIQKILQLMQEFNLLEVVFDTNECPNILY